LTTQPQLENLIDIEEQYQVATYKKFPFVIERDRTFGSTPQLESDTWIFTAGTPSSRPVTRIRASLAQSRIKLRV